MGDYSPPTIGRRFDSMDEPSAPMLIIKPPWVMAPGIGTVAVDVTHGAPPGGVSDSAPMLCLGGHPAQECLLGVRGSGPSHEVVVWMCDLAPERLRLLERLGALLRPTLPLQVLVSARSGTQ
jgi:hypothetical protein